MSTTPNQYPRTDADEEAEQASQDIALNTDLWENFAQLNYVHIPISVLEQEAVNRQAEEDARQARLNHPLLHGEASQNHRVETVRKLRMEANKDNSQPTERSLYYLPKLEYKESHPSPYAPTLGIEIEIFGPTLGLKASRYINDDNEDEQYWKKQELQTKFAITQELGVPSGGDGLWEFAHSPVNHPHTLTREVQALIDMGFINREFTRHPLHLTIGGVTAIGKLGGEAYTLARALEASAWSTRGGRLLKPYHIQDLAWDHKGYAGVQERTIIKGNNNVAIEIRTMQFQSLTGLHRLLTHSYYLGAALKAYQEKKDGRSLPRGETTEGRDNLASIWAETSKEIKDIFKYYDVGSPSDADYWGTPKDKPESNFFKLADLLDEAAQDKDSEGSSFVAEVRDCLVWARLKASKVMKAEANKRSEPSQDSFA